MKVRHIQYPGVAFAIPRDRSSVTLTTHWTGGEHSIPVDRCYAALAIRHIRRYLRERAQVVPATLNSH